MSADARAFEYVLGTLTEPEREAFERAMKGDADLAASVRFWEEQLMVMQNVHSARPPGKGTWQAIERRIAREPRERGADIWQRWWPWALAFVVLLAVLAVPLAGLNTGGLPAVPNSDYVAVLIDDQGSPRLTAMTLEGGKTLWLQWENVNLDENSSAQLWAVSRRDGQTRPIAVFDQPENRARLPLDQARRRLIADAEYLLLTEEGPGGSPLDEPSAQRIARGACVRLSTEDSS